MITFEKELIYTGKQDRISKKTNNPYTLVNYLGETGESFSTIAECKVPELNQLDKVKVLFNLVPGRYFRFETLHIEKV